MLRSAQAQLKGKDKESVLTTISTSRSSRRRPASKKKKKWMRPKDKVSKSKFKAKVPMGDYFHYRKEGHWKRNYLEIL